MENQDVAVLRKLHSWRHAADKTLLVTVTRTWGSSPRPVGSVMALNANGAVVGSVSGGCIEDDLIRRYITFGTLARMESEAPQKLKYGVTADEAHRFGLPCGGTIELLVEFNSDPAALDVLLGHLDRGELVLRSLDLRTGQVDIRRTDQIQALEISATHLMVSFGPAYRMLLIGAGQLSEYLATMAVFSGFDVSVCDPRMEYRNSWSVPGVTLLTGMPDDEVLAFRPDKRSCVITLTHDPKLDDMALLEALESGAFYVGAIGSRRNSQLRRDRMVEYMEIAPRVMDRLHGPAGIYIGSKTPPEIAVSIMAEVIAVKNGLLIPKSWNVREAKQRLVRPVVD